VLIIYIFDKKGNPEFLGFIAVLDDYRENWWDI
jgi:hypothetical protein